MGDTKIEWTDATWNPVTGCSKVSPGCARCYAEALSRRFGMTRLPWTPANAAENVVLHPERLGAPLRWRKPRRVFVNSMSDLFHEQVPDEFIDRVFAVMAICGGESYRCRGTRCEHTLESSGCGSHNDGVRAPIHTFQILTKRPERMRDYLRARTEWRQPIFDALNDPEWPVRFEEPEYIAANAGWPLPNVWLGVSVENQRWADERIPLLLDTPAVVRFVSCEPLLSGVDLGLYTNLNLGLYTNLNLNPVKPIVPAGAWLPRLDWVIVGGESGPRARPFDLAWARSLRDQCAVAGVPFFMKQLGGLRPGARLDDLPPDLRIREYP